MTLEQAMAAGLAAFEGGRLAEAESLYRQILIAQPNNPDALHLLGLIAHRAGQHRAAIDLIARAISIFPGNPDYHSNLCLVLATDGRPEQAIDAGRAALRLRPEFPEALNNLGYALALVGRRTEGIECFRAAIRLRPDFADAYGNLGTACQYVGRLDEAIAAFKTALNFQPNNAEMHSRLIGTMHFHPGYTAAEIFAEEKLWNDRHAAPFEKSIKPHDNDRNPLRRLRIGYVSANFHEHSVAYFLENLLAHHDTNQVEVFCYADIGASDTATERLKRPGHQWRIIRNVSDDAAAETIRRDGIDILVDLGGHTVGNRLLLFARKPAPIQVTWLGFPGSTGLSVMDYRFTDAYADPPGTTEQFHSEQLVRLPRGFLCYAPPRQSPEVAPLPALSAGHVTFGSFNMLPKISAATVELWAEILSQSPGSRLIVKSIALMDAEGRQLLTNALSVRGVDVSRVELHGWTASVAEHLHYYDRIDIALDTIPYNGTTTTCEALWMGVPVVALAGKWHASRVGVSILSNVGFPELTGQSENDYVRIAMDLAANLPRLASLRASMRDRLRASPLMNGPEFARIVESAYRDMWRRYSSSSSSTPTSDK